MDKLLHCDHCNSFLASKYQFFHRVCIPAASKNAILKEIPLFKKGFQANFTRSISTEYDIILSIVLCVSGLMSIVALDRV